MVLSAKDLRLMVKMILDNNGKLSQRKRKHFAFLTGADFQQIDTLCQRMLHSGADKD